MNHGDWKALFYAVTNNDINQVKYYLKMGIDMNYQHPEFMTNPFFESIRLGRLEMVDLLLKNGANLDTSEIESGKNPLQMAQNSGNKNIIKILTQYNMNNNRQTLEVLPEMKAAICTRFGPPDVITLKTVSSPQAKHGQVLVKIMASTLNSGDVRVRGLVADGWMKIMMRLLVGWSQPRKAILGVTFSGIVVDTGPGVKRFKIGDRVYGLTGFNFGCHAEYTALSEKGMIAPMPKNINFQDAAALLFGGQTAIFFLLKSKIDNLKNPKVLILGGSGSVGTSAIQIAKYFGAEVTTVCSSSNVDLCTSLGADHVVAYDINDFTKTLEKYDIVLDAVAKYSKKQCQHLLYPKGVFKTVGGMEYASENIQQLELLSKIYNDGKLSAVIDKVYKLDQIVEAHQYVDTGKKKGNVIIEVTNNLPELELF